MLIVVAKQRKIGLDQILLAHAKPLVHEQIIAENDAEFHRTRDQRADGGTAHAKLGRAQISRNKQVVDRAVDNQRNGGHDGGDAHDLHRAQKREQRGAQRKEQIGPAHDFEIFCALCQNFGRIREQTEDEVREQRGQQKQQKPQKRACADGSLAKLLDGRGSSLPPVLAAHGHQRVANADGQLLKQKLQGIDGCNARERGLAVAAYH